MPLSVDANMLIHPIGDPADVAVPGDLLALLHLRSTADRAVRTLWRFAHHHPRTLVDQLADHLSGNLVHWWTEMNMNGNPSGQFDRRNITIVSRFEHDHFISFTHKRVDGSI